jgi:hypothetical protein
MIEPIILEANGVLYDPPSLTAMRLLPYHEIRPQAKIRDFVHNLRVVVPSYRMLIARLPRDLRYAAVRR